MLPTDRECIDLGVCTICENPVKAITNEPRIRCISILCDTCGVIQFRGTEYDRIFPNKFMNEIEI